MGIIKGQNLRLKLGTRGSEKYVAFSTDCTCHVAAALENSSTKDTEDALWSRQEIVGMSWDATASALYSVDEDETGHNAENSLDIVLAGQRVWVEFVGTDGAKNRSEKSGGHKYCGYAWVSDISIQATNRTDATYNIQLTGDGILKKDPAESSSDI